MSEVGDNRDNRGHFSDALSSKPATPNLKMEYKFENQNQSNLKSALSKPTTPSNFLSHSNMKLFKKISAHKEIGIVYCDESLIDSFSKWNHGKGQFYVSNSFYLFWQDYRLVVHCRRTDDSYLLDDDVYCISVNVAGDFAVAVSQNIAHFIRSAVDGGEDNDDATDNGDEKLAIHSISFQYEPRNTNLSIAYCDPLNIFCISSASFVSLYFYHKAKYEILFLDEFNLALCSPFKLKDDLDPEVVGILNSNSIVIKRLAIWTVEGKVFLFISGDENWISICTIHAGSLTDEADNLNKITLLTTNSMHQGSISAISEPNNSPILLTGDSQGSLAIWTSSTTSKPSPPSHMHPTNNGADDSYSYTPGENELKPQDSIDYEDNALTSPPHILYFYSGLSEYAIVSFLIESKAHNHTIWVGDALGVITGLSYNAVANKLSFNRKIMPSTASIPQQLFLFDQSAPTVRRTVLRSIDSATGAAFDAVLYDSSTALFRAHLDCPPRDRGPWNLVDLACVLPNLQVLLTCGADKSLFVWDISTCQLLNIIHMEDQLTSFILAIDKEKPLDINLDVDVDIPVSIFCGHQKGCIHIYTLILQFKDCSKSPTTGFPEPDGDLGSLGNNSVDQGNGVAVFDILEQSKDALGGGQSELQSLASSSIIGGLLSLGLGTSTGLGGENASLVNVIHKLRYERMDKGKCLELCALPVTDLAVSRSGKALAACFAKMSVLVYSMEKSAVIKRFDFDTPIAEISPVIFAGGDRSIDDLVLVIQDLHKTTLCDALTGKRLTQFELDLSDMDIYCSLLWELSINTAMNNGSNRSLAGICVTRGLGIFLFSESAGCSRLLLPECASAEYDSPLNSLVMGCEAFELGESPMVCIWTLRRLIIARINLGLDGTEFGCMKLVDYVVPDRFVRIISAKALSLDAVVRYHRVVVVLSDGSTSIINI